MAHVQSLSTELRASQLASSHGTLNREKKKALKKLIGKCLRESSMGCCAYFHARAPGSVPGITWSSEQTKRNPQAMS